jgi:hypothetical protein
MENQKNNQFDNEQLQEFLHDIQEYLRSTPDEFKSHIAYSICMESIIWGSDNHYEALGILEELKLEYRDISIEVLAEEDK